MANDYYPLLSRAVAALESNTSEARQDVYRRARQSLEKHFQANPTVSKEAMRLEIQALEDAFLRIESEMFSGSSAGGRQPRAPPRPGAWEREPVRSTDQLSSKGGRDMKYEYKVDYLEASVTDRDVKRGDAWQKTSAQVEVKLTEYNKQGW